jgi:hypothetical protein
VREREEVAAFTAAKVAELEALGREADARGSQAEEDVEAEISRAVGALEANWLRGKEEGQRSRTEAVVHVSEERMRMSEQETRIMGLREALAVRLERIEAFRGQLEVLHRRAELLQASARKQEDARSRELDLLQEQLAELQPDNPKHMAAVEAALAEVDQAGATKLEEFGQKALDAWLAEYADRARERARAAATQLAQALESLHRVHIVPIMLDADDEARDLQSDLERDPRSAERIQRQLHRFARGDAAALQRDADEDDEEVQEDGNRDEEDSRVEAVVEATIALYRAHAVELWEQMEPLSPQESVIPFLERVIATVAHLPTKRRHAVLEQLRSKQ